jgi:hypothetical protein
VQQRSKFAYLDAFAHVGKCVFRSGEVEGQEIDCKIPSNINTQEEIAEAFDRYRAGKMGRLEAVHVSA